MRAEARVLLWLVAAAIAAAACSQAETNAQTNSSSAGARQSATQGTVPAGAPLVLEFDLPAEFRLPQGTARAVTAFRIGFFRKDDSTAIRTIDVGRDALTVRGGTARVTVARENVPQCADCGIRVQTLSRDQSSVWSDLVPLTGADLGSAQAQRPQTPQQPRAAQTERPRTPSRKPRPAVMAGDIEKYASLSELLRKLLPADAKLETELARFRRVQDVALAAVISRDYDIPFTTLSKTIEGPPRRAPRSAVAMLRQDLNAQQVVRKARAEVNRLIGAGAGNR